MRKDNEGDSDSEEEKAKSEPKERLNKY